MLFRKVIKLFKNGNVCVTGLRGTGKDLLFGNVIARRKKAYVSNMDYGGRKYFPVNFDKLNCGGNVYDNFINGDIRFYRWEYPLGADVYISDAGIYFPSQYCSQLNNKYGSIATYQALSRQVSKNNFHVNTQNLNRVWDKIREQSDTYIRCRKCIYIFGFVFQWITIYDKAQSCIDRVKPCKISAPFFNKQARMMALTYKENFYNSHGKVENKFLFYWNKSKHDTYRFRELMERGR